MATPESKVKKKVVDLLKSYGVYFFYPVTGGYGRSGVPDIVACWKGRFIGIECKTKGNKPTALQMKNLMQITDQHGISLLVDETGIGILSLTLSTWDAHGIPVGGFICEMIDKDDDKDKTK